MKKEIRVLGIYISDRMNEVQKVQSIFTKFGCSIKTRLGLNEPFDSSGNSEGLIILELTGDTNECIKLENELLKIESLDVKKMIFTQG